MHATLCHYIDSFDIMLITPFLAPFDFSSQLDTLVFPAGSPVGETRSFQIPIFDDSLLEDQETIGVFAEIPFGEGIFLTGLSTALVFVAIEDDDLTFIENTPTVDGNLVTILFNIDPSIVFSTECTFPGQPSSQSCECRAQLRPAGPSH